VALIATVTSQTVSFVSLLELLHEPPAKRPRVQSCRVGMGLLLENRSNVIDVNTLRYQLREKSDGHMAVERETDTRARYRLRGYCVTDAALVALAADPVVRTSDGDLP